MNESKYKCEECRDTGLIETESIHIGRSYYNHETKQVERKLIAMGDWTKTQCYCVGENE